MYEVNCKRCGKRYKAGINKAGFCPECRIERQKERNAAYLERKYNGKSRYIGDTDSCARCGKQFVIKTGSQKLCPDCIAKGVNLAKSKSNTAYRNKTYDSIHLYVPKGEKEKLKEYASSHNMSLNELFTKALDFAMNEYFDTDSNVQTDSDDELF